MEDYIGIVAEKDGNEYITPRSGHIKGATLVKVDYNGNIIGEEPVGKRWPGIRLSLKTILDPHMHYLATPDRLDFARLLRIEKNIGVGPGRSLGSIVRDLRREYIPEEKVAPAYAR